MPPQAGREGPDHQLSLFDGEPAGRGAGVRIAPAEPDAELAVVASRLPADLHLGTSSWTFPGWRGLVYGREEKAADLIASGLSAYAAHPVFRTVGVDRAFYAPLTFEQHAALAAQAPDGFRFLLKAHDVLTRPFVHSAPNPRFLDAEYAKDIVIAPALRGLDPDARASAGSLATSATSFPTSPASASPAPFKLHKLGPILFQFAPLGARTLRELGGEGAFIDRLGGFLGALPRGPVYAVEIRDRVLWTDQYRRTLAACGVAHCFNEHPAMVPIGDQIRVMDPAAQPAGVIRWMLHRTQEYEAARDRYAPFDEIVDRDDRTREAIARLAVAMLRAGLKVWIIANNKAEGSAPRTIFELAAWIDRFLRKPV